MQTCSIGATVLTEILNALKFRGYRGINFVYRHQWNFEAVLLQVCEDRWVLLDLNQSFLASSKIMSATKEEKILHLRKTAETLKQHLQKGSLGLIQASRGQIPNQPSTIYHFILPCHWDVSLTAMNPGPCECTFFSPPVQVCWMKKEPDPNLRGWKRNVFNWVWGIYPRSERKNTPEEK